VIEPISVEIPSWDTLRVRSSVLLRINITNRKIEQAAIVHAKVTLISLAVKGREKAPPFISENMPGQSTKIRTIASNLGDLPKPCRKNRTISALVNEYLIVIQSSQAIISAIFGMFE